MFNNCFLLKIIVDIFLRILSQIQYDTRSMFVKNSTYLTLHPSISFLHGQNQFTKKIDLFIDKTSFLKRGSVSTRIYKRKQTSCYIELQLKKRVFFSSDLLNWKQCGRSFYFQVNQIWLARLASRSMGFLGCWLLVEFSKLFVLICTI